VLNDGASAMVDMAIRPKYGIRSSTSIRITTPGSLGESNGELFWMATIYSLSNLPDNRIPFRVTASDVALANIRQGLPVGRPDVCI